MGCGGGGRVGLGQCPPHRSPRIRTCGSAHQGCSQGPHTQGRGSCQAWVAGSATAPGVQAEGEGIAHREGDVAGGGGSRRGLGWVALPHRGRTPRRPLHPRAGVGVRAPRPLCPPQPRLGSAMQLHLLQRHRSSPASEILAEAWPPFHCAAGYKFLSLR